MNQLETIEADLRRRIALTRARAAAVRRKVGKAPSHAARRDERAFIERLRGASSPRVLVVDLAVPAHDRSAGGLRMTWILRLLRSLDCHVTLFPAQQRERLEPYTTELQGVGVEVNVRSPSYAEFAAARAGLYDLVILSTPAAAGEVIDASRRIFPEALVVYDCVDLQFLRLARQAAVAGGPSQSDLWYATEVRCIGSSDLVATVTETEGDVVRSTVPSARIVVLPTVHQLDSGPRLPYGATSDLLFIGGFLHAPNADAVSYFVREIFPLVTREIDVRLWVIGQDPPEEVRALESSSVVVTGYVPHVESYFRRARVFVSPLRFGAGMKGKNGHAMAFGLPLVTTPVGAEGMDLVDGEHVLIRDGAQAFAAGVLALYRDRALWERLSTSSQQLVNERWSPDAMRERLNALLETAVRRRSGAQR